MSLQAEYLKQLEVDLWLPRRPLSLAAPSPAWVYELTHPAQALSERVAVARPQPIVKPPVTKGGHSLDEQHAEQRSMAHIAEALALEPEATAPRKEVSRPAVPQRAPQPVPRFRIVLTRTPRFLIVDELPVRGPQVLSEAYKRLLVGVVRALDEEPQQMSLPVVLQWPHLAGSKLNQGADEAFKYVQLTLESMQKRSSAESLLLFGGGLSRWVIGEEYSTVHAGELLLHPNKNISCLATATLSEALQLPEIKRQIWLDLQPVVCA